MFGATRKAQLHLHNIRGNRISIRTGQNGDSRGIEITHSGHIATLTELGIDPDCINN